MSQNHPVDIKHSRYLSLLTATAVATIVPLSIGVYLSTDAIFSISGRQAALTYLLSTFFFVPILLSLAERVTASKKSRGMFSLMRENYDLRYAYAVGWLMLGGLFFLGALLAYGGGIYFNRLLLRYFESSPGPRWLAAGFVLAVFVNRALGGRAHWTRRLLILVTAIVVLVALLLWANANPPLAIIGYTYLSSGTLLEAIPYLAISLWGVHFLLEKWPHVRASQRQVLLPMMGSLLLMVLLGALTAAFFIKYPLLLNANSSPLLTLATAVHPLMESVLLLIGILLALMGVDQVMSSLSRLMGEMASVGFLPQAFMAKGTTAVAVLLLLTTATAATAAFLPLRMMVGGVIATLSLIFILLNLPGLLQMHSPFADDRPIKLPLHPLFPMMSIVISGSFLLYLTPIELVGLLLWLIVGAIYYFRYARAQAIVVRQYSDFIGSEVSLVYDKKQYRLVAGVSSVETAVALIHAGVQIARARHGDLLVIHVITTIDGRSDAQEKALAAEAYQWMSASVAELGVEDVTVIPMVRIAPTVKEGLNATIWEEKADGMLLGWPTTDESTPPQLQQDGAIDNIVRITACEVMVLRGKLPDKIQQTLVPMISEQHAAAALALARQLDCDRVVAYKPIYGHNTPSSRSHTESVLRQTVAKTAGAAPVEIAVEQAHHLEQDTIHKSETYDLLILGMSGEGFLTSTAFGGTAVSIASQVAIPTILVKQHEKNTFFWMRRMWEGLSGVLPDLSSSEKGIIGRNMRRNAKADIDFYVLLILAALIAFVGLLQNSAAVIIGAMLVAPLMSPILALAHSIVRGNIRLMRQSFSSTISGVVFAIALPTMLMLLLEALGMNLPITSEIAARTEPGMLDLIVALLSGAVAAYAISQVSVAAALPGVAIAAALVPPLAVVGYGLGTVDFDIAGGAFLLFVVNFAAIVLSGALMFLLLGVRPPLQDERGQQTRSGLMWAVGGLILVLIPLLMTGRISRVNGQDEQTIRTIVEGYWPIEQVGVEDLLIARGRQGYEVQFVLYDYGEYVQSADINMMQKEIEAALGKPITIFSRTLDSQRDVVGEEYVWIQPTATPLVTITATRRIDPVMTVSIPAPTMISPLPTAVFPSATPTLTSTVTLMPLPTLTSTPTFTPTATQLPFRTVTPTSTPIISDTITPTLTPSPTITATSTLTPTAVFPTITPTLPITPTETAAP